MKSLYEESVFGKIFLGLIIVWVLAFGVSFAKEIPSNEVKNYNAYVLQNSVLYSAKNGDMVPTGFSPQFHWKVWIKGRTSLSSHENQYYLVQVQNDDEHDTVLVSSDSLILKLGESTKVYVLENSVIYKSSKEGVVESDKKITERKVGWVEGKLNVKEGLWYYFVNLGDSTELISEKCVLIYSG